MDFWGWKKGGNQSKSERCHWEGVNPVCHLVSPLSAHCYPIWDKLVHLIRTCHPYQCSMAAVRGDIANPSGGGEKRKTWEAGLSSVATGMFAYRCCFLSCPSSARNVLTCTFSTGCVTGKAYPHFFSLPVPPSVLVPSLTYKSLSVDMWLFWKACGKMFWTSFPKMCLKQTSTCSHVFLVKII